MIEETGTCRNSNIILFNHTNYRVSQDYSKKDSIGKKVTGETINGSSRKIFTTLNYLFTHLDLTQYKISKCEIETKDGNHDNKTCVNYHNKNDKRRSLLYIYYHIRPCKLLANCVNKNCNLSNNKIEILYHNEFYKKKYCINYYQNGNCEFGKFCSFAHSDSELRINVLHTMKFDYDFFIFRYKTEFCPLGNIVHNKNKCVYAHNFQDYRRKNLQNIEPKKCKNWDLNDAYREYTEGCEFGFNCKYSHGWKEICYHPKVYKSKKCNSNSKNCKYYPLCHYYHEDIEGEFPIKEDYFNYVPKNLNHKSKINSISYSKLFNNICKINKKKEYIKSKFNN